MTCAKQVVKCAIVVPSLGRMFVGENSCANPQGVCPRLPGEGYEKCKSICKQGGHAEINALLAAADAKVTNLTGAEAIVYGHSYLCRHCQESLLANGINKFTVIPKVPT